MTTGLPRSTDPLLDDAAPLLRRLAALAYDALLLFALLFVFTLAAIVLRGGREIGPGTLWFEASLVAVALLFCAGFWTRGGQTLVTWAMTGEKNFASKAFCLVANTLLIDLKKAA